MGRVAVGVSVLILILISPASTTATQEPQAEPTSPGQDLIRVFLDCSGFFCDFDHVRREVRYVDWVRDRQDADVHVQGTSQQTGGGGREFTFVFIGQQAFAGREDTLRVVTRQADTEDERRNGMTRVIQMGLVRYAATTTAADQLRISYSAPQADSVRQVRDPWDYWVFRPRIGGFFNGESRSSFMSMNGTLAVGRTTPDLKIDVQLNGSYFRQAFEVNDTTTLTNIRREYEMRTTIVWSLNPRVSAGFRSTANSSTFLNQDLTVRGGPALEYNLFPYDQSTRRQLTILYSLGPALFDYKEETIFDQVTELRATHSLEVGFAMTQRWGSLNTSADFVQFLHDATKHRLTLSGNVNLRLVRGLSLNLGGNATRVKDQLYLPKGDLTTEEILLQRRQLGTDFRYFGNVGLTFTFGSIFDNVVNPRFQGGAPRFFF